MDEHARAGRRPSASRGRRPAPTNATNLSRSTVSCMTAEFVGRRRDDHHEPVGQRLRPELRVVVVRALGRLLRGPDDLADVGVRQNDEPLAREDGHRLLVPEVVRREEPEDVQVVLRREPPAVVAPPVGVRTNVKAPVFDVGLRLGADARPFLDLVRRARRAPVGASTRGDARLPRELRRRLDLEHRERDVLGVAPTLRSRCRGRPSVERPTSSCGILLSATPASSRRAARRSPPGTSSIDRHPGSSPAPRRRRRRTRAQRRGRPATGAERFTTVRVRAARFFATFGL